MNPSRNLTDVLTRRLILQFSDTKELINYPSGPFSVSFWEESSLEFREKATSLSGPNTVLTSTLDSLNYYLVFIFSYIHETMGRILYQLFTKIPRNHLNLFLVRNYRTQFPPHTISFTRKEKFRLESTWIRKKYTWGRSTKLRWRVPLWLDTIKILGWAFPCWCIIMKLTQILKVGWKRRAQA